MNLIEKILIFSSKKFFVIKKNAYLCAVIYGKMAEWSNVSHSKCDVGVTLPGVRIPLFPPRARSFRFGFFIFIGFKFYF